jgi:hypothetical protein
MKALTICQPYAELILLGVKLVENRVWQTNYRGPLLIHAGKSREWMETVTAEDRRSLGRLDFGAVVGVVDLVKCLSIGYLRGRTCDDKYKHLANHEHTSGPFCFVLENPRRFVPSIPSRGMQGLWDVPELTRRIVLCELARMPKNVGKC